MTDLELAKEGWKMEKDRADYLLDRVTRYVHRDLESLGIRKRR